MLDLSDLKDTDESTWPSMDDLMPEPCPVCAGPYKVGDEMCWGECYMCAKKAGKLPKFLS